MKLFFLLLFIACLNGIALGQGSISGKVTDEKQQPAAFVTVTLSSSTDSLSTLSTEAGTYIFTKVKPGNYHISVTSVGYKTAHSTIITMGGTDINMPDLHLLPDGRQLNEVRITVRKKFIEQRADKLIVNVQNSVFAAGASASDILRRVPGIRILNDRLVMAGKNKPVIMVDGRLAQYQDLNLLLKSLPAIDIEKIEVLNNPSAKYDAEGDAIINIILKRKHAAGTNATIGLAAGADPYNLKSVSQGNKAYQRYNPSISVNHQSGIVNIFAGYNYLRRAQFDINLINRYHDNSFYDQRNYNPSESETHTYQAGADVRADSLNTFGIMLSGYSRNAGGDYTNNSRRYNMSTGALTEAFTSENEQSSYNNNLALNLNWRHNFSEPGSTLSVDADAAHYLLRNESLISVFAEDQPPIDNYQQLNNPINFQTLKADYTYPINKTIRIETGAKTSFAKIDNPLLFDADGLSTASTQNHFLYKENITALYGNVYASYLHWDLQGGLRAEQTVATGTSDANRVLNRNYVQLFPSVLATRKIDSLFAITAQLGRRIGRPSYLQQNPFEVYLDPLTYTKGNPLLKPQVTNSAKLSLTYSGQPVLAFAYDQTHNVIVDYAPQQKTITDANGHPQLVSFSVADNLAQSQNFTGQLNFPIKAGNVLDGYGGLITTLQRYHSFYQGQLFNASKWNYTFFAQSDFKISSTVVAQVSAYHATPSQYEFIRAGKNSSIDAGISKKILNNKGKIGLSVTDIFWQDKTLGAIKFRDIDLRLRQYTDTRNVIFAFTYNLGTASNKNAAQHTSGAEEEAKRVKTE